MNYPLFSSLFGVISAQNQMPKNEHKKVRLMINHNPEKAKQYIRDNLHVINDVSQGDTLINDVIDMQNINVDMVKFLVENKADLTIRNWNRQTPLQRAKQLERLNSQASKNSLDEAVKHKKYLEIVKILEKAGAKE
jgi:hypothetical protein